MCAGTWRQIAKIAVPVGALAVMARCAAMAPVNFLAVVVWSIATVCVAIPGPIQRTVAHAMSSATQAKSAAIAHVQRPAGTASPIVMGSVETRAQTAKTAVHVAKFVRRVSFVAMVPAP